MAVLVQLKTPSIEPKRLEALKKAISHRKVRIEGDALTGSEDENQEIDVVEDDSVDPLQAPAPISSPQNILDPGSTSSLPLTQQPQHTTNSCDITSPPKDPPPLELSTSVEVDMPISQSNHTTDSLIESSSEISTLPTKSNSNEALLAELQTEEERIVKKIEKLKEEKHKLFIAFKRIISEENEEGAVQESDPEDSEKTTDTIREKSSSPIDTEESKKPHDPTRTRESSFSIPNPAFKRRRSPTNAPPNYNNSPNNYRKNSRTGANTRGGGAFHYPGRGRAFVSQYPNRGRNGYYNERDFRMAPGFIRPPLVYGRSLMHIPQVQADIYRANTNPVSRFGFNFPHPGMIRHNTQ